MKFFTIRYLNMLCSRTVCELEQAKRTGHLKKEKLNVPQNFYHITCAFVQIVVNRNSVVFTNYFFQTLVYFIDTYAVNQQIHTLVKYALAYIINRLHDSVASVNIIMVLLQEY